MQADLDRRHGKDPDTIEAQRKLNEARKLAPWLDKKIYDVILTGASPQKIIRVLADEIARAERLADALRSAK